MARKREKKVVLSGITAAQMEEAMAAYASADAETAKINAAMDVQFTAIREKYSARLTELASRRQQAFDTVQAYATENRDTLFAKKKSQDNSHGTFGFRTGTPKLKTRRGFTWAAVLELRGAAPRTSAAPRTWPRTACWPTATPPRWPPSCPASAWRWCRKRPSSSS